MNKNTYSGVLVFLIIIVIAYFMWPKSPDTITTKSDLFSTTTEQVKVDNNAQSDPKNNNLKVNTKRNKMHIITLETNKGPISFETYDLDAPRTVDNFINLVNKDYYNGIIFHRVIKNFMIQGGDPTGTGRGGPGYTFEDELNPDTESYKNGYKRGVVAMANAGPNTNGSQFFIMHKDTPLPNNYTIFGNVISGMDVVDAIATTPTGQGDVPIEKMYIKWARVEVKK